MNVLDLKFHDVDYSLRELPGVDELKSLSASKRLKRICRSNIFLTVVTVPISMRIVNKLICVYIYLMKNPD